MQCNSLLNKNRIDSPHDQVFARLLPLSYAVSLVSFVGDNFCAYVRDMSLALAHLIIVFAFSCYQNVTLTEGMDRHYIKHASVQLYQVHYI